MALITKTIVDFRLLKGNNVSWPFQVGRRVIGSFTRTTIVDISYKYDVLLFRYVNATTGDQQGLLFLYLN